MITTLVDRAFVFSMFLLCNAASPLAMETNNNLLTEDLKVKYNELEQIVNILTEIIKLENEDKPKENNAVTEILQSDGCKCTCDRAAPNLPSKLIETEAYSRNSEPVTKKYSIDSILVQLRSIVQDQLNNEWNTPPPWRRPLIRNGDTIALIKDTLAGEKNIRTREGYKRSTSMTNNKLESLLENPERKTQTQQLYEDKKTRSKDGIERQPKSGDEFEQRPRGGDATEQRSRGGDAPEQRPRGGDAPEQRPRGGDAPEQRPRGGDALEQRPRGGDAPEQRPRGGDAPEQRPRGGDTPEQRPRGGDALEQRPRGGDTAEKKPRGGEAFNNETGKMNDKVNELISLLSSISGNKSRNMGQFTRVG